MEVIGRQTGISKIGRPGTAVVLRLSYYATICFSGSQKKALQVGAGGRLFGTEGCECLQDSTYSCSQGARWVQAVVG